MRRTLLKQRYQHIYQHQSQTLPDEQCTYNNQSKWVNGTLELFLREQEIIALQVYELSTYLCLNEPTAQAISTYISVYTRPR